jgi:hypothetical protein
MVKNMRVADLPEQANWREHESALGGVPRYHVQYRGCFGIALVVASEDEGTWRDYGGRVVLPDASLSWATLVDIPEKHYGRNGAPVTLASVRPTRCRFGMPTIGRPDHSWRFDLPPQTTEGMAKPRGDVLSPTTQPQLTRVFNAVNWSMSSTAFQYRAAWKGGVDTYRKQLGLGDGAPSLIYGDGKFYRRADRPRAWMPTPLLAFDMDDTDYSVGALFDQCTTLARHVGRHYTADFRDHFVQNLAEPFLAPFPGTLVGVHREGSGSTEHVVVSLRPSGSPETVRLRFGHRVRILVERARPFGKGTPLCEEVFGISPKIRTDYERFDHIARLLGDKFENFVRNWFARQIVTIEPDHVHVPASLAATAAVWGADEARLAWDVTRSVEYFNTSAGAFVFPPVQIDRWDGLSGTLPGAVAYSVMPDDLRIQPSGTNRRERRKTMHTAESTTLYAPRVSGEPIDCLAAPEAVEVPAAAVPPEITEPVPDVPAVTPLIQPEPTEVAETVNVDGVAVPVVDLPVADGMVTVEGTIAEVSDTSVYLKVGGRRRKYARLPDMSFYGPKGGKVVRGFKDPKFATGNKVAAVVTPTKQIRELRAVTA